MTVRQAIGDLPERTAIHYEDLPYPATDITNGILNELRLDRDGRWYASEYKQRLAGERQRLHNHHTKEIRERRKHLIALLAPGAKADSLPIEIWNGARPEKWRRLHPDKPAYTILAQMHRDLSEWVHPDHQRWITAREAAKLGFDRTVIAKAETGDRPPADEVLDAWCDACDIDRELFGRWAVFARRTDGPIPSWFRVSRPHHESGERTMEAIDNRWRKSSYSGNGGNCVEVGQSGATVLVSDTKNHGRGPVLVLSADAWRLLTAELKRRLAPGHSPHTIRGSLACETAPLLCPRNRPGSPQSESRDSLVTATVSCPRPSRAPWCSAS